MTNMSYCRFENTYHDLEDCYDHINDLEDLSASEKKYRLWLIEMCQNIIDDAEYESDDEE